MLTLTGMMMRRRLKMSHCKLYSATKEMSNGGGGIVAFVEFIFIFVCFGLISFCNIHG